MKCECKVVEGELKNRSRTNNDWTTEINCIWEGGGVSESFNTCTGEIWRLYRHSHHSDRLGVAIGREASFLVFTESDKMTKRRHDKIRNSPEVQPTAGTVHRLPEPICRLFLFLSCQRRSTVDRHTTNLIAICIYSTDPGIWWAFLPLPGYGTWYRIPKVHLLGPSFDHSRRNLGSNLCETQFLKCRLELVV